MRVYPPEVNFLGHSVVAYRHLRRHCDDPTLLAHSAEFSLGAMLPDFASMLGARRIEAEGLSAARGIAFHHATDRVFHRAQPFVDFERRGRSDLRRLGVRRGPSYAAAHIGVELMFDAELFCNRTLAGSPLVRQAWLKNYVTALETSSLPGTQLRFVLRRNADTDSKAISDAFKALMQRLLANSTRVAGRHAERSADTLARRVAQALVRRPKLALTGHERALVMRWAQALWPELSERMPIWLQRVQDELGPFDARGGAAPVASQSPAASTSIPELHG